MALNVTAHVARGGNVVPVKVAADFNADYPQTPVFYVEVTAWATRQLTVLGPFPLQVAVGIGLDIEANAATPPPDPSTSPRVSPGTEPEGARGTQPEQEHTVHDENIDPMGDPNATYCGECGAYPMPRGRTCKH